MASREWQVAFVSDGMTGETIADFTDREPGGRPAVGAGETAEISWGADGIFRLRLTDDEGADQGLSSAVRARPDVDGVRGD